MNLKPGNIMWLIVSISGIIYFGILHGIFDFLGIGKWLVILLLLILVFKSVFWAVDKEMKHIKRSHPQEARCRKCGNNEFDMCWGVEEKNFKVNIYRIVCNHCKDIWGYLKKCENNG